MDDGSLELSYMDFLAQKKKGLIWIMGIEF